MLVTPLLTHCGTHCGVTRAKKKGDKKRERIEKKGQLTEIAAARVLPNLYAAHTLSSYVRNNVTLLMAYNLDLICKVQSDHNKDTDHRRLFFFSSFEILTGSLFPGSCWPEKAVCCLGVESLKDYCQPVFKDSWSTVWKHSKSRSGGGTLDEF